MKTGFVTTPFGRRPMTLALLKGQLETDQLQPTRPIEKWKVFRDVAESRQALGIQDRALAVLDALLTFYPSNELSPESKLVVFPSNAQLSVRAHGIAGTTLRRHLAALVDAGLIHRRDSPNGKRYAHRDRAGNIEDAFGFDLKPLVLRAAELARLAQEVADERRSFKRAKEALTLCRRDVRKLITAAMEEGSDGDWTAMENIYVAQIARLPRTPIRSDVETALNEMARLREEIVNRLGLQLKYADSAGNDVQNSRHIHNSNTESINEVEPRSGIEQGEPTQSDKPPAAETIKAFPLGLVLRACPQVYDYGPAGKVSNWRDMMVAAVVVRSALGVSPSAYQDCCDVMGPENAAVAMACILERAGHINSAGGYLRDLTARAKRGEFSLGPMLMALVRTNAVGRHVTSAS